MSKVTDGHGWTRMDVPVDPEIVKLNEIIIGAAMEVSRVLGHGFLESVYRNSLRHELEPRGQPVEEEVHLPVHYKQKPVGSFFADLIVDGRVIVELKCAEQIVPPHVGQVLNYLKITGLKVGLILNFGQPKLQFKQVVL